MKNLFFLVLFFSTVFNSYAFKKEGHIRIENEAYTKLKNRPKGENLPDGETIMKYLLDSNILVDNLNSHSAYPDFDFARQFLSDRQIYHFMASKKDVMKASKENTLDEKQLQVTKLALPECLNMIYVMFREVIDNNKGADQAGRGIYVLIHIIADSYSREHTARDRNTDEITSLKSWRLSKIFWPERAKTEEDHLSGEAQTLGLLHTIKGAADKEWQDKNGKLTDNAKKAAEAIESLLIAVYQAKNDKSKSDSIIVNYLKTYFKPKESIVVNNYFVYSNTKKDSIKIGYENEYSTYDATTIYFDSYPRFSQMLSYQNNFNDLKSGSFGCEFGFHVTPFSAFLPGAFLRRLPVGILAAACENSNVIKNEDFFNTVQFQLALNTSVFIPWGNMFLEPKFGYGFAPFYGHEIRSGFVAGGDITFNIGPDFKFRKKNSATRTIRISIGYERDYSGLPALNTFILKIGLNTWQGRIIKKD